MGWSDVQNVSQQAETHPPLRAITGVDGGGAAIDAHDGAHHGLQVLVLKGDLLTAAKVVARRSGGRPAALAPQLEGVLQDRTRAVRSRRKATSTLCARAGLAA